MWRAFFLAIGTMLIIVGVECLLIDSATFASDKQQVEVSNGWLQPPQTPEVENEKVFRPKEWIPWSSLATGAIVLLYSFTLPKRWGS